MQGNCKVTYTKIKGDTRTSTKNYLIANKIIDSFDKLKDQNALFRAGQEIVDDAKDKYKFYFPERPFVTKEGGTKVKWNEGFFGKLNGVIEQYEKKRKDDYDVNGDLFKDEEFGDLTSREDFYKDKQIRQKYFADSPVTDSVTILEKISNSGHKLAPLAKQLIKYAKLNNSTIILDASEYIMSNGIQSAGVYKHKSGDIQIAEFTNFRGGQGSEATIIHEILHSLTHSALKDNSQIKQDLEKLFNASKKSIQGEYALTNLDEFIVALFTDDVFIKKLLETKPTNEVKYKNLLEEIFDYILSIFGVTKSDNLYQEAYAVATHVLEYAYEQNEYLSSIVSYEEFGDMSAVVNQIDEYEKRTGNKTTKAMRETVDKLLSSNVKLNADGTAYVNPQGEVYQRTGTYIKGLSFKVDGEYVPKYFEFGGQEEDYQANRDWGNQIDEILTGVVEGLNIDEVRLRWQNSLILKGYGQNRLTPEVVDDTYNKFKEFVDNYDKNAILIPQITLKSDKAKVAGTSDLIAVYPDGLIKIIDLKSGIKSTIDKEYKKPFYLKTGEQRASKFQKHSTQLSVYKALAMSMGVDFKNDDDLSILPMFIAEQEGTTVTKVELEPVVPIDAYKEVINNLYEGQKEAPIPRKLIDAMLVLLENRKIALKYESSIKSKSWKEWNFKNLQNNIRLVEEIKAVENFVDNTYEIFVEKVTEEKTYKGIIQDINEILRNIKNKKVSSLVAINELYYYKALLDNYKPVVKEVKEFYQQQIGHGEKAKEGTLLWKMQQVSLFSDDIEDLYYKSILPEIAGILAKQVSGGLSADVKKVIEEKEKTLERVKKEGKNAKYIKKIEDDLVNIKRQVGGNFEENKALILKELIQGSYRDIGSMDAFVVHAAGTNNLILSTFAKTILEEFENSRLEAIDFERQAVKAFEEFKGDKSSDNPTSFNQDFYETVTNASGNKTLKFAQPLDENAYNAELAKALAEIEAKPKESSRIWREFYDENHMSLPEEDVTIENPVTKKQVVLIKGKASIRAEYIQMKKDGILSASDLIRELGTEDRIGNIDRITIPNYKKFPNKKYQELQKNPSKKKYYDYLVASYFKSQEVIPLENRPLYRLPSINKSTKDAIIDDPLNYGKKSIQDLGKIMPKDEQEFGTITSKIVEATLSEQEASLKIIPVLFSSAMPHEDVSTDLITSIITYNTASLKYKAQAELSSFSNALLETVQTNAPLKENSIKDNVLDAVSRILGVSEEAIKNRKKALGDNNLATSMAAIIDMHIYGKQSIKKTVNLPLVGDVELNKVFGKLMGFAAFTQIGGNPILSLTNYLNGNVQNIIEAAAGKHFSSSELGESKIWYNKLVANGTFIKDFTEPINKSLEGQIIDLYDPMQGEFKDLYGRKISQSVGKKLASRDTWFFLQRMGEHSFQVQAMRAILKRAKVIDKDGKSISLYDAYIKDENGNIKLKEGVVLPGKISNNGLVALDIQNTLHGINKSLGGVYNTLDKVALERYWYGKLVMMYKKFFVPGIRRRYRSAGIDYETGAFTEGFYRTFYSLMIRDTKQLLKFMSFQSNELTDLEKQNVKRALSEMSIIMITGAIVMLLTAGIKSSDDDEEKKRMRYLLYLTMRLNTEIGVFGGLGDPQDLFILPNLREVRQIIRQPFALWSIIDKLFRLLNQLQNPTEVYKRDTGIFEKGDNKAAAAFIKFWGISGVNFSPEIAISYMQMNTK
jgi:hypothetical protein